MPIIENIWIIFTNKKTNIDFCLIHVRHFTIHLSPFPLVFEQKINGKLELKLAEYCATYVLQKVTDHLL